MKARVIAVFVLLNVLASGWAALLVQRHNQALAETLSPGLLCGEAGGCGAVLASEWSSIAGIAVSAPGVPLYLFLAVLGALTLGQRFEPARLSAIGALGTTLGLLFGGWLLYHMLVDVGSVCGYCLVMDGLNLGVLIAALALHPDGMGAALRALPQGLRRLVGVGPELALLPAVLVGTALIHLALPPPTGPDEAAIAAAVAEATAAIEAPPPAEVEVVESIEETGKTRRVVLQAQTQSFELGPGVPVEGPATAPVTIVLFEDFQCPFCRKLAGNLEALRASRPDDVRIAWFDFPMHTACNAAAPKDMHPRACGAAVAGVCAHQQGQFWPMHDRMFLDNARLSDKDLVAYAGELGLDPAAFSRCMADPASLEAVRASARIGAEAGVRGTPTFFVNGHTLAGAQPVEVLEAVVDQSKAGVEGQVRLDVALRGEVLGSVSGAPSTVALPGPHGRFTIDAFEASIVDGAAVSTAGAAVARGVDWYAASAACKAAGKRLCTEEEWLTACTGEIAVDEDQDGVFSDDRIRGRRHPYGDFAQEGWCAASRDRDDPRPLVTGEHPRCATPDGIYDLEGLTKEWVGTTPDRAGAKGGSYFSKGSARCGYFRDNLAPDEADPSLGFRCCSGPLPEVAERLPGGKVGDAIQDWRLPLIDGGELLSSDLAGQPYIMTFWASWCGPCRKELPALAELHETHGARGLRVIGVNVDQQPAKARAFLARTPLPFSIVMDSDAALQARFDAPSVPTTFWVDAEGQIRRKTAGYDERGRADLDRYVEALLGD